MVKDNNDRIESLKLTAAERERAYHGETLGFFSPHGLEQVADAQLERVLSAEIKCLRCNGSGRRYGHMCRTCGGKPIGGRTDHKPRGSGTVALRQILERDGGEK